MYRRTGRGRLLLLVFLALSIVVITLDFRQSPGGPLERAKDLSAAVVAPIQRGVAAVTRPVGDFFSTVSDLADLRAENRELEASLQAAEQEIGSAEAVLDENERLRALLELDESYRTMDSVNATVYGRAPSNYKWAVYIDKGTADGIRPDMAVVNPDGLVGKIVQTSAHTSTVLLLVDPTAAARARVVSKGDVGVVRGNGGSESLSLTLISGDLEVDEGDEVVTAGMDDGIFPPSILIGTVSDVGRQEAAPEQEIEVEPAVDFTNGLDYLKVLLETGPFDERKGRK